MPVSRTPSATPSTANSPRTSHLALIVMIGLCLFFIVSYAGRVMQRTYLEAEAVRWEAKIEQAEANTLILAAERSYVESDAYIQEKARNELGLVQPGDALVIVVPSTPTPVIAPMTVEESVQNRAKANWQQWLELFVPAAE
jgi:cell division protein FtsB